MRAGVNLSSLLSQGERILITDVTQSVPGQSNAPAKKRYSDEEISDGEKAVPGMLKACVHNHLVFRYILNDVWFASSENMTLITPIKPQN